MRQYCPLTMYGLNTYGSNHDGSNIHELNIVSQIVWVKYYRENHYGSSIVSTMV